jgi:hypothetical protein
VLFTFCYILIASNLCMTSVYISESLAVGYSALTSSYSVSNISSLTGWLIRFTSDCLYYYYNTCVCICQAICLHSVTMYRNRWRASRTSLRGETPPLGLRPRFHSRNHTFVKCASGQTVHPVQKKRAKRAVRFSRPPRGVDNPAGNPQRLDKFMLFFIEQTLKVLFFEL